MMQTDIVLVILFIFLITWLLRIFFETPGTEAALFGCIILFLTLAKFKTVLIIKISPLSSLLYSAVILSLVGVMLAVIIKRSYIFRGV